MVDPFYTTSEVQLLKDKTAEATGTGETKSGVGRIFELLKLENERVNFFSSGGHHLHMLLHIAFYSFQVRSS